jgi:hypothetical protein
VEENRDDDNDQSDDPRRAIRLALRTSGRVVVAAAGLMIAVFLLFALSGPLAPKEMGIILACALFHDASGRTEPTSPSTDTPPSSFFAYLAGAARHATAHPTGSRDRERRPSTRSCCRDASSFGSPARP